MSRKPLAFGIFQTLTAAGTSYGSWRHPDNRSIDYLDVQHWVRVAKLLDKGGLDFIFFADSYGSPSTQSPYFDQHVADARIGQADPTVLASAIAAATESLAVIVTSSTTVERPQGLTRRLSSLDHFTSGRIGWNIVTGSSQAESARLFGEEMTKHDDRYAIATDHVELCLTLWEGSWERDGLIEDKETGVYADPRKIHDLDYAGPYFKTHGRLSVPPSPQGTPVLLQAGTSPAGRDLAAKYAEVVFLAGGDPAHVRSNIDAIRERAVDLGREADSIKFLVGASFITAPTEEEARVKRTEMNALATTEGAAAAYHTLTGIDLLSLPQDEPLGGVKTEQGQSSVNRFAGTGGKPPATVAEILEDYRVNGVNGTAFVGAPDNVADQVEAFVEATGADGFLVQPYLVPDTYVDLIELILPVMRERGLARDTPAGTTLREHLFGEGHKLLPDNHPGARHRVTAAAVG